MFEELVLIVVNSILLLCILLALLVAPTIIAGNRALHRRVLAMRRQNK